MAIQIQLRFLSGPDTDETIPMAPGQSLRFGQDPKWCDIVCEWDNSLSLAHFVVDCSDEQASVRDLNTRTGTLVNGVRIRNAVLKHGDRIAAGNLLLGVEFEGAEDDKDKKDEKESKPAGQSPAQHLLELLRKSPEPLFAVLDAARDPRVIELIRNGEQETYSLLEGQTSRELSDQAPYLIQVKPDSPFLEALVLEGWGKAWGFYLTSPASHYDTREHLRQFLMVNDEKGKRVYFRFYDPRIFRAVLPVCTPPEVAQLFGPIHRFLVESDDEGAQLFVYTQTAQGLNQAPLDLKKPEQAQHTPTRSQESPR